MFFVDLDEYWSGALSFDDLLTYTSGLKVGSRISETWSQQEHLIADTVDLLNQLTWLNAIQARSWCSEDSVFKSGPEPLVRPGVEPIEEEVIFSTDEEIARLFGPVYTP